VERMRGAERRLHPACRRAVDVLHRDVSAPHTLAGLAARVGMSASHLGALFRHELGCGPMQYLQQRRGSIMGYGGAVSVGITTELSVGVSGLLLDGTSDDYELTVGRGLIHFGNNNNVFYHTLDSVYARTVSTGMFPLPRGSSTHT